MKTGVNGGFPCFFGNAKEFVVDLLTVSNRNLTGLMLASVWQAEESDYTLKRCHGVLF
jgi:hypothetical protein